MQKGCVDDRFRLERGGERERERKNVHGLGEPNCHSHERFVALSFLLFLSLLLIVVIVLLAAFFLFH
jgi:hypothetical protein